jgi:gentisate 1,2-dioxygenase
MRNKLFDFDGLHLGIFEFAPSLPLALHKHTGDCVYYIERGSIVMGNREIHAGDGFLVPDSHPYGYVVGPEGVRLIEFSQTPRCDITILDRDITNWTRRLEKAVSRLEAE